MLDDEMFAQLFLKLLMLCSQQTCQLRKMPVSYPFTVMAFSLILLPQAMKMPAAKAAVDKECEKLSKIPA